MWPRTYVLEARYIGYARVAVQDVIVRTDLTTTQNFELSLESFEGEEIVVVVERQAVIKDITSSEIGLVVMRLPNYLFKRSPMSFNYKQVEMWK